MLSALPKTDIAADLLLPLDIIIIVAFFFLATQYLWPATGSDSGTQKVPGGLYTGSDPNVAPGALLALPADIASNLTMRTVIGRRLLDAFRDYGAYIVDDTGSGNSVAICQDAAVNEEMRRTYGFAMTYPTGVTNSSDDPGRALYSDLLIIFENLHAVTNNGPGRVGGGGTPRRPPKRPFCE